MIELNHILLFLAIISPLAVLARALRSETAPSWRIASFVVLAITGVTWILFRGVAGYVGAGAWLALLFLPSLGVKRVAELAASRQFAAAGRLAAFMQFLHPSAELREQVEVFRKLALQQGQGSIPPPSPHHLRDGFALRRNRLYGAWAVIGIILLNLAAFALEGKWSTDPAHLLALGALEPGLVIYGHQYWRLGTALFLHYGLAHVLFNLLALYVLGPALEKTIGSARFLFCYLVSGLGSSAGVVLLTLAHLLPPVQLVGASGCVMGIVGTWTGFLLRHRHAPDAAQRLKNVLTIIVVQVLFDISTPQVSMSAHLCGLATGFFLGLVLTEKRD